MKTIRYMVLIGLVIVGCNGKALDAENPETKLEFNQALKDELAKMAETDQIAAFIPTGKYKELSREEWSSFKDSIFKTHTDRLHEIFSRHGYPGYDLVGEEGASNFWLMVQHADHDPEFQNNVLEKMKMEVDKGNAEAEKYGYLMDRVNLNTGKAQLYGTQVSYNTETCQAFPLNLADSANVNQRRQSIGLPPLEGYLNQMTEMHFEMNKESYLIRGIKEPKLYETPSNVDF